MGGCAVAATGAGDSLLGLVGGGWGGTPLVLMGPTDSDSLFRYLASSAQSRHSRQCQCLAWAFKLALHVCDTPLVRANVIGLDLIGASPPSLEDRGV
jgi:hypothetical protein